MSEEAPEQSPALPAEQPVVGDTVPPPDLPFAYLDTAVRRLKLRAGWLLELRSLARKDKTCLRILKEILAWQTAEVPSRKELEDAKRGVRLAIQRLNLVRSKAGRRSADLRMMESELYQRVTTLREREERKLVTAIREKLGPAYRARLRSEESEPPSPTSSGQ